MKPIPRNILYGFNELLKQRKVPPMFLSDYRKWLLYFLDFSNKYPLPDSPSDQVRLFTDKLRSKKQTAGQIEQAEDAISLYFESHIPKKLEQGNDGMKPIPLSVSPLKGEKVLAPVPDAAFQGQCEGSGYDNRHSGSAKTETRMVCKPPGGHQFAPPVRSGRRYDEWRCLRKTESPAWDTVIEKLADEIKVRHYSRKTLKHYADWGRKFQNYLKDKAPGELSPQDVKAYLTHLAVNCTVSSSRQNQAFNALLFLYRHILKKDFGSHNDIPRAKTSNYVPTVLCRKEIDSILLCLRHPFKLVAKLQYGCGLRISEGCRVRVKDIDFTTGMLTIRGKGKKVRTVPLPKTLLPELKNQLERVKKLHDDDLAAGYSGVFLDDQLEKKYPRAAKELIWQPRDFASPSFNQSGMRRSPREVAYNFGAYGSC